MKQKNEIRETALARPALIIDADHYERLLGIAMRAMKQAPALAKQLLDEIERADLLPSAEVPTDVVGIGSEVTFRENSGGVVRTVHLVFPTDADIDKGCVSVLTPLGAALLGLSVGQDIAWEIGGRVRRLTIVAVNQTRKPSGLRPSWH